MTQLSNPETTPPSEEFIQGRLHELGRFTLWCDEKTQSSEFNGYLQQLMSNYIRSETREIGQI
jgi:hypothetical protein